MSGAVNLMSTRMMSASLPGCDGTDQSAIPSTRAPPMVAISTTFSAGSTVGSPEKTL